MSTTACDDQFNDPPIETSEAEARPYAGGAPENIRAGDPYDDLAFERLAREHDIWGRAESALCAVFWLAGKKQPPSGQSAAPVGAPDRIFLVIGEGAPANTPFGTLAEVTWCPDRVNNTDIEYVRAQPATATVSADAVLRDAIAHGVGAYVEIDGRQIHIPAEVLRGEQPADATEPADAQVIRKAVLEEAAAAVEQHDRTGRSWVPDSLWGNITREAAGRIRALKGNSHGE
ncbi:hypothetical protein WKR98_13480 [Pigmentiphaga sp. YJ18]|uniref:hypothetical protein n=1 Tax=Pigmentiphaga sp. YJ18 TaxID=3134907 RepID=UPI00311035A8